MKHLILLSLLLLASCASQPTQVIYVSGICLTTETKNLLSAPNLFNKDNENLNQNLRKRIELYTERFLKQKNLNTFKGPDCKPDHFKLSLDLMSLDHISDRTSQMVSGNLVAKDSR